MKTAEQELIAYCLCVIHDLVISNNHALNDVLNATNLTEGELFDAFHTIAEDNGFELQPEE